MFLTRYQAELEYCLGQAAELLGGAARPVRLAWELHKVLWNSLIFETRRGLGREPPVLRLDDGRRAHSVEVGLTRFRWDTLEGPLRVVHVVLPDPPGAGASVEDFWAVAERDFRRFYRSLRRQAREGRCEPPPVMAEADRERLWNNTVGFLRRSGEVACYGVVPKRGVLLLGEPGNGKTMACRWLAGECRRHGLAWKNVTLQMYDESRQEGALPRLFWLSSPGIILFDDFDAALRDRRISGQADLSTTFLAELDGVERKSGVVYLFTSNAEVSELDPAMRRPGRIDVILRFPRPDEDLRRRVILQRWHPDLLASLDVEAIVAQTEGLSFAELEEVKNLLVLRHLDTGRWDWPWVRRAMEDRREGQHAARPIGFQPRLDGCFRELAT